LNEPVLLGYSKYIGDTCKHPVKWYYNSIYSKYKLKYQIIKIDNGIEKVDIELENIGEISKVFPFNSTLLTNNE
jgi:hypothetical protein